MRFGAWLPALGGSFFGFGEDMGGVQHMLRVSKCHIHMDVKLTNNHST